MKKCKPLAFSLFFLLALWNISLSQDFNEAGPGSVVATVDSQCNPIITQFTIGLDFQAVQFTMVSYNGGTDCTLGSPADEKEFTIESQNGTELYKWYQYQENPPLQPLGELSVLFLASGTYSLKVTGGKDAQVILRFNVEDVNQPTPSTSISDSDRDGVPDIWDKCPNTPYNSLVDSTGCPGNTQIIDTDRDGVIDMWDTEPNTPPNSLVDRNGRSGQAQLVDSDGDGVIDQWDIEPNTPPGSLVNRSGQAAGALPVQAAPPPPTGANVSASAPWEIWLGRWEVVTSYTNCPGVSTLSWWFEVMPQGRGYVIQVQSGHKTKLEMLSDQKLEFSIQDDTRTRISLYMTSEKQCEGTSVHPKHVRECQQGQIVGQKRFE